MQSFFLSLSFTTFSKDHTISSFLGDSLTEGYGVPAEKAYPVLVKKRLFTKLGKQVEIFNLGVSGSTTSSGLTRLKWITSQKKVDLMILALGANDGLEEYLLRKADKTWWILSALLRKKNKDYTSWNENSSELWRGL